MTAALRDGFCPQYARARLGVSVTMRQTRFCGARTRRGSPCQCKAIQTKRGAWRCRLHRGLSTIHQQQEDPRLLRRRVRARGPRQLRRLALHRSIEQETRGLLLATLAQVAPLYRLEKEGGFHKGDPRGIALATSWLAAGARSAESNCHSLTNRMHPIGELGVCRDVGGLRT